MKTAFRISLFLMLLLYTTNGFSQGLLDRVARKAARKAEQKVEDRIEKKVEEGIDKSLDQIEDSIFYDEEEPEDGSVASMEARERKRTNEILKKMGVSSEPVPIAEKYHFSSKMCIHYQTIDDAGNVKDEGEVITYISPGEKTFAYEFVSGNFQRDEIPSKGIFIMDYLNRATIILSDENGEKSGLVYGSNFLDDSMIDDKDDFSAENEEDLDYINPYYTKTGRTKKIHGYRCDEYAFDNVEGEGSFWVTEQFDWDARDTFSAIFSSGFYFHGNAGGVLMEITTKDKNTGEQNLMKVTELNQDASVSFVPGEYQLTNFGAVNIDDDEVE